MLRGVGCVPGMLGLVFRELNFAAAYLYSFILCASSPTLFGSAGVLRDLICQSWVLWDLLCVGDAWFIFYVGLCGSSPSLLFCALHLVCGSLQLCESFAEGHVPLFSSVGLFGA